MLFGQRMQIVLLELVVDRLHILPKALQQEVQAISPLADSIFRLGKHPRYAAYRRKIDLAGIATENVILAG